ncbi:hypothetical protein ACFXA9_30955, partial [Streptomyces sp. NPDC059411]
MKGTGGLLAAKTTAAATAATSPSAAEPPPVTIGRDAAREAARHELSKPVYHQNDPGLFQRAWNRFWEWVGSLFDHASASTPGGTLGLLAIAVFVVLVIAALWWGGGGRRPPPAPPPPPEAGARPPPAGARAPPAPPAR